MAGLLSELYNGYNYLMDTKGDPRVRNFPMMSSPFPTFALCIFYAYFSKYLGPRLMADRKPFNLRKILIYYNLFQTIFSSWIFYEYLMSGWWGHYDFRCQPVDYSNNPMALRMVRVCWWYYISKFTEFMDTLFFILRKKNEHVSTLHVIHHGCMPFSVWMGMKFAPGGHSTFFALLNSFVHIVMYFYYMISAMGPKYQKYIWWKKYLTTFQMVQFVFIFGHQFQLLFRDCDYPKGFMIWIGLHGVMFLFLFSDFYKSKYTHSKLTIKANTNGFLKKDDDLVATAKTQNGDVKTKMTNGTSKPYNNLVKFTTGNGSNKGACMPVLDDDDFGSNGITAETIRKRTIMGNGHLSSNGTNGIVGNMSNGGHTLLETSTENKGIFQNGTSDALSATTDADRNSSSLYRKKIQENNL